MVQSHILCTHGLGPHAKTHQRPVEEAKIKEVEQTLSRVLQDAGKAFLTKSVFYKAVHLMHLTEAIAACRAQKGAKNTSEALKRLGLEKFDT